MDNVNCVGSEPNILQCNYDSNTIEDNHGEDAGVRCSGKDENIVHVCMSILLCTSNVMVNSVLSL